MENTGKFSINQTINLVIGLAVFIGILFLILQRVDKGLKIEAIDDCYRTGRIEKTILDEQTKAIYPITDVYKNCLKDKGY